ncbi:hypothetical protein MSG28_000869 [Choristoneura fumiferana]|uniref:Uncharacterized protein n=2 Tax=Choristoneura fumiferana TaxID=7141 RepID=A0ACC0K2U0_CHOFU|nr:hypothetical protein MSG28_000868 [Choristoneura fumiferana]KAI8430674.1 hypothetical protein MSG28_000869 [Choristoneura fumiferana]
MGSDKAIDFVRSDFKSSLHACLYLTPDWLSRVRDDYKEEVCYEARGWPIKLIERQGRLAVWNVAKELNVHGNGVAALACRLMERYLSAQLRHNVAAPADSLEFERFQRGLSARIPVLIASCVQIAAKSISAAMSLTATQVCNYLIRKGTKHSIKDIVTWEYHVFQTIGYRVPLWTSAEMAELLATAARLAPAAPRALALIVNLAELKRDEVDRRVRWAADLEPSNSSSSSSEESPRRSLSVRTLHLAAGAVAACARCLTPPPRAPDLERRLAALTGVPQAFVECVRDCILTVTIFDDDDSMSTPSVKRRRLE